MPIPYTAPAIENINGQAITLAIKHKDKRNPKDWKGMKFAVPFDFSMHNYLLRYYLAEHGIDPDQDVQIRAVPPPEMVANLRADNIDGFLGPDPMNQRAVFDGVGFIHILSKDIWEGHPCCVFAASKEFVTQSPNTYAAVLKAIIDATAFATKAENRKAIAEAIAPANYINQPVTVLEQILTGTFADGLGSVKTVPNRVDFDPFPWESFAVWIMTQMKRWGQLKGDVDYAGVAKQVFLATDTTRLMKEVGLTPPAATTKSFAVMGKTFDPAQARGIHQELCHQAGVTMLPGSRRRDRAMTRSLTLRAAFVSILIFATFMIAWHLATRGTGTVAQMDPEYAKLMGATATQGKSAMPGPLDVGGKLWEHLGGRSTTTARTTRASASSSPSRSRASPAAICSPCCSRSRSAF